MTETEYVALAKLTRIRSALILLNTLKFCDEYKAMHFKDAVFALEVLEGSLSETVRDMLDG